MTTLRVALALALCVLFGCSGPPTRVNADAVSAPSDATPSSDARGSSDATPLSDGATTDSAIDKEVVRVLFIGNSYTSSALPNLVQELGLDPLSPVSFEVGRHTPGGARWDQHDANPDVDALISEGWDYVVLQDQSTQFFYPNIKTALISLDSKIKAAGAETVLFMTWGRGPQAVADPDFRFVHHMLVGTYYDRHGDAVAAKVAPVGRAWERALREPGVALHTSDGSHPNAHGVYLNACVFFMTLTGQSPVGLGTAGSSVTAQEAAYYQQIALETHLAREMASAPLLGLWSLSNSGLEQDLIPGPALVVGNAVDAQGNAGGATSFDSNVYAAIPYFAKMRPAKITVHVEVKRDDWSVAAAGRESIVGKAWGYHIYQVGNTLRAAIHTVDTLGPPELSTTVSGLADGWHDVALTYDGSNYRLWVDGAQVDSAAASGDLRYYENSATELGVHAGIAIGGRPTTERHGVENDPTLDSFTGALSNLRIFDASLSEAELGDL